MAPTPSTESKAAARRQVSEEMLLLGQRIDRQKPGPERLELLRQQARLSDRLEALQSVRR
jgi:hypothetical protein